MKIIGTTGSDGFIIEATRSELASIEGDVYHGTFGALSQSRGSLVGTVFNPSRSWSYLTDLRQRPDDALKGAAFLRAFAEYLERDVPRLVPDEPPAAAAPTLTDDDADAMAAATARAMTRELRQWLHRIEEVAARATSPSVKIDFAEELSRVRQAALDALSGKGAPRGACETISPDDTEAQG